MGLITESKLRREFLAKIPQYYMISSEDKLTPAARDFLKERDIEIRLNNQLNNQRYSAPLNKNSWETPQSFVIKETGENVLVKPEGMTHLYGNVLVPKDHPRIILRGKLDTLQSLIIDSQVIFEEKKADDLVSKLDDILNYTRSLLRVEVLNEEMRYETLMGLSMEEIRDMSHHPEKYFSLKQMVLVNRKDGIIVSKLNYLRAKSRECELSAVKAFENGKNPKIEGVILGLNRLSSCFHILMYQELSKNLRGL